MSSIRKEKNGTWTVQYDRPDAAGRGLTKKRGFATKRDAADFLTDIESAKKNKTYVHTSETFFTEYINETWIPNEIDAKVADGRKSIGTKEYYEDIFNSRFENFFRYDKLQELTADRIEAYLDFLRAQGTMCENTVHAHFKNIRTVLRHAMRYRHIAVNPIDTVDPPKYKKPDIKFWEPEIIPQAINLFTGTEIEWHVRMALLTLLRESEICALHEDWFDYKSMEFDVKEQAHQVKGGGLLFIAPKSDASEARLPMTDEVARLVHLKSAENKNNQLKWNSQKWDYKNHRKERKYSKEFTGRLSRRLDGTLIRPHRLYHLYRKILQSQDEIPYITFHALRHTGAVWHVECGTDLKVLQRLLRHADFNTTVDIYADVSKSKLREAVNRLSLPE